MEKNMFIENATMMAKGQLTVPKDVRSALGLSNGDKVTFIVDNNKAIIANSAVYAMELLQREMKGEAENAGLNSEEAVIKLVKDIRKEGDNA